MIGFTIIFKVVKSIFNVRKNNKTENKYSNYNNTNQFSSKNKKKVFDSDEGEYIDFEEIKN